jgi:hypothetical protein
MCSSACPQRAGLDAGSFVFEIGERQRLRDKGGLDVEKMCKLIDQGQ